MSKTTLVFMAALGAGGGAAATAALFSLRSNSSIKNSSPSLPSTSLSLSGTPPASSGSQALVNPAGLFEYGFPGPVSDLAIRSSLVSSYDRSRRNPAWVAEHITPESVALRSSDRKRSQFFEDENIPVKFRALLRDYARSGYDRGHQVPAADAKWSQEAMDATFALSNMSPQVGDGFNRDYWAHFEDFCRRLTIRYPSVRIVTGPLYLPKKDPVDGKWYVKYEMIGSPPNVAVPTHFYKVIFAEDGKKDGNVAIGAFMLPNTVISNDTPLRAFEVPLEMLERASGLEFAEKLPLQRRKMLCTEADCSILVKEYAKRQEQFTKKK